MPSHIDCLVGDYGASIKCNMDAVAVDEAAYAGGAGTGFYLGYMGHNYHMLVYSAMLAGDEAAAVKYATPFLKHVPEDGT